MSVRDPLAKQDGFQTITGGVDSGRAPAILDRASLVWAVNATTRDGFITCRPGWSAHPLSFPGEDGATDDDLRTAFENGLFQGAHIHINDKGAATLLASITGRIYSLNLSDYRAQDLTAVAGITANHPTLPQTWSAQAENFLILQNCSDAALIYDGGSLRRSNWEHGALEVPTGAAMAYNNGRLWIAVPASADSVNCYSFIAGDIINSAGSRSDVLKFTDTATLTGAPFFLPATAGPIRSIHSLAIQDSSTGQGPLQVITTNGIFSVNVPFNRDLWGASTTPLVTISLLAAGTESALATVNVNGDIWFRASDGVRSFVVARRDQGTWVNTPLSSEMTRAFSTDTPSLLRHASAALFDNRLLVTCAPTPVPGHGITHQGLAILDFRPVSSMFNRSQPVWEGTWTGLRILQLIPVETSPRRLLAFALDASDRITLWELSVGDRFDARPDGSVQRIQWSFETPSYGFETGGWNLRQLATGDTWHNRIAGQVDIAVRYRPDSDPVWQPWTSYSLCASYETCAFDACSIPPTLLEQYRARVRFPEPSGTACDILTNKPYRHGYRFAARVEAEGFCQIPQLRLLARDIPEESGGACPASTCALLPLASPCTVNDYSYSIT